MALPGRGGERGRRRDAEGQPDVRGGLPDHGRDPATETFSAIGAAHGLSDPDIHAVQGGADFEEDGDVPADAEARWWARKRIVAPLGLTECDRDPELPVDVAERIRRTSALAPAVTMPDNPANQGDRT